MAVRYTGHAPNPGSSIDRVDGPLNAPSFWEDYVSRRKPVLINGLLSDPGWNASGGKWSHSYLKVIAGAAQLLVEKRESSADSFGKGRKLAMSFADFLDRISAGDKTLYLSTQPVAVSGDGHPELMGPPMSMLKSDIVRKPELAGNLVPQQVSLWMGASSASSGLHHDFHDNIYILLRGRKRFRLFDPSQAPNMYLKGRLRTVHANGRIVYESQGQILADGTDAKEVKRWRERVAAERGLAAAEARLRAGTEGAARQLQDAEARLDALLGQELEAGGMDEDGLDDFDLDNKTTRRPAISQQADPPSFSKVDLSLPKDRLKEQFPLFPGVAAAVECLVEEGQMLYLPAGWFHEVTSFPAEASQGQDRSHVAVNYWFHPPDNLDSSKQGFDKPYTSDYWPALWRSRSESGAAQAGTAQAGGPEGKQLEVEQADDVLSRGGGVGTSGAPGKTKKRKIGTPPPVHKARPNARPSGPLVDEDGDDPDYDPGEQGELEEEELDPAQAARYKAAIRQLLLRGLFSGGEPKRQSPGPKVFVPPLRGRRHHPVMYAPAASE